MSNFYEMTRKGLSTVRARLYSLMQNAALPVPLTYSYDPAQPRDKTGKWTAEGADHATHSEGAAHHAARREEAKAGKNGQAAARHHATQLAHEAAAHIKNGDHAAATETLDRLKKGVSALHVQMRYAKHNDLGDEEIARRDGATKHYQQLQKNLRNAIKTGKVPAVTHYHDGQGTGEAGKEAPASPPRAAAVKPASLEQPTAKRQAKAMPSNTVLSEPAHPALTPHLKKLDDEIAQMDEASKLHYPGLLGSKNKVKKIGEALQAGDTDSAREMYQGLMQAHNDNAKSSGKAGAYLTSKAFIPGGASQDIMAAAHQALMPKGDAVAEHELEASLHPKGSKGAIIHAKLSKGHAALAAGDTDTARKHLYSAEDKAGKYPSENIDRGLDRLKEAVKKASASAAAAQPSAALAAAQDSLAKHAVAKQGADLLATDIPTHHLEAAKKALTGIDAASLNSEQKRQAADALAQVKAHEGGARQPEAQKVAPKPAGDGSIGAQLLGGTGFGAEIAHPKAPGWETGAQQREIQAALAAHKGQWKLEPDAIGGKKPGHVVHLPDGGKLVLTHDTGYHYKTNDSGKIKIGAGTETHQIRVIQYHPNGKHHSSYVVKAIKGKEGKEVEYAKKRENAAKFVQNKLGIEPPQLGLPSLKKA